jgi:hypothetical protein
MQHIRDYILIIGFFFLGVFAYESCHKSDIKPDFSNTSNFNKIKEIHDTVYTKTYTNRYIKGDSIPFVIIATDTIATHDTAFIMYDYNVTRSYSDTIKKDSNIFVINDTISQNSIKSRSFQSNITNKTIYVKEYYAEKAKYRLFYGIRGDFSPSNGLEVVSPGLILSAKNKAIIGFNVNINKINNMSYSGSLYFKIGKK